MDDKSFKLEIVTPRKVIFSGDVVSFTAPGVMGSFQVLTHHAPLLAMTGVGEAKLREPHGDEIRFATSGGFVDVKDNHVVMLAESAERSNEIDTSAAQADRERALKIIREHGTPEDIAQAKIDLEIAVNRIRVANKQ